MRFLGSTERSQAAKTKFEFPEACFSQVFVFRRGISATECLKIHSYMRTPNQEGSSWLPQGHTPQSCGMGFLEQLQQMLEHMNYESRP